ncbi:MAG: alginate O-acetyltransferase complex protein AlgI [Planctomycetota bacterium]|jgi:alginate O-acetyltransferase complex protein AlgI
MLFVEFRFLLFFAVAFGVHWSLRGNALRKAWLLGCSLFFYAAWDWRFLGLILVSTVVDYVAGLQIDRPEGRRKVWLGLSLCVNLGLLGVFKYYDFFVDSAGALIEFAGFQAHLSTLELVLPVGISFYTFQTLSYTLDVYAGRMRAHRNFLDVALFVAFFPQLVAGPIVRARDFLPQMGSVRRLANVNVRAALLLFLVGFVKKACVSDNLATYVDAFYAAPEAYNTLGAWTALLFYTVQIYCDFSGYSDMAIGAAALLGYRLCLNFHFPYLSGDISSFWRRWHISLSSWLRDYLFISLGGSRGKLARTIRNVLLTFALCGLWHGAAWHFVVWGMLHGVASCLRLLWKRAFPESSRMGKATAAVGVPVTFLFVTCAWAFFRADVDTAWVTLRTAFAFSVDGKDFGVLALALFGVLASAHVLAYLRVGRGLARLPTWAFGLCYGCAFALALAFVPAEARPFIYFQF